VNYPFNKNKAVHCLFILIQSPLVCDQDNKVFVNVEINKHL